MDTQQYTGLEIAVIGMAGRFPGAADIAEFWNNLKNGVESIGAFTEEELLKAGEDPARMNDPFYVRAHASITGKEYFDPSFFNYTPDEARLMDPQARIFHECVWAALEDAGCTVKEAAGKIGLFAGASANINWEVFAQVANREGRIDPLSAYQMSNVRFMASRISYALNLRGPSIFLDTACSTSLVAIHQACRSLLVSDCHIAIAGAVKVNSLPARGYMYSEGMVNSRDGHCRTFDAQASGSVEGEGAAVVILKTLKHALKEGDKIWAIIKGSGINNDGNNKVGYTAPSVDGQSEAILMAQRWAKVAPETIGMLEAHGTATKLGDPIEVQALNRVFGKTAEKYCALGSVKTNIGHLDAAAGIAGLIKVILALHNRQIPPTLNFTALNPEIDLSDSPFYINTRLKEWKNDKYPRRAGVSSFGIGGTNAHLVLEEPPQPASLPQERSRHLLVLSAKTPAALQRNTENIRLYLQNNGEEQLADIAFTLQTGRIPFPFRKTIVCKDRQEALQLLAVQNESPNLQPVPDRNKPSVVFLFSGQGAQYVNMCADLYREEETFRKELDRCFTLVGSLSGKDLYPILFTENATGEAAAIDDTEFTQPILFSLEYALASWLMEYGIHPDVMIGHSIGEYVAACLSGIFLLEDALLLVIKRAALMQKVPKGIMLSIAAGEGPLTELLAGETAVSLAAVNSPQSCVVAGNKEAILAFKDKAEARGYHTRIVRTSHAFHSYMMEGILEEFEKEVAGIKTGFQRIPFISNLTGVRAEDDQVKTPAYWVSHLRQTVKFGPGIATLLSKEDVVFIEVGPGKTLSSFVRSAPLNNKGHKVVSLVRHSKETGHDLQYLLSGLGELWASGILPDWGTFYKNQSRRKVSLPAYSFEKTAYPATVDAYKMLSAMTGGSPAAKKTDSTKWFYAPSWKLLPPAVRTKEKGVDCIALFSDDCGVAAALMAKYTADGKKIISVSRGEHFVKRSAFSYEINPAIENDYIQLFADLSENDRLPDLLIHAWAVTRQEPLEFSASLAQSCFYSLLEILKGCRSQGNILDKRLVVLTNALHPVLEKENSSATKALSLALLKVFSQEYPALRTNHIDIHLPEEITESFSEELYREVGSAKAGSVVSVRNGRRWEQTFERVSLPDREEAPTFRKGGVYLITGGLGSLGYTLANYLLTKTQARVILLGRTKLPPKEEWDFCRTDTATPQDIREKIIRLERLEKEGEVVYLSNDLSRPGELSEAIRVPEQKLGAIQGIIHAAGVINGSSLSPVNELQRPDFEEQFAAKITGLQVLREVMETRELDFCLIVSSISAVLGGIGLGAYAPANIFADYYISSYKEKGRLQRWMSVDLDGLQLQSDAPATINKQEVIEVLDRLAGMTSHSRIVVSVTELEPRLEKWIYRSRRQEEELFPAKELFPDELGSKDIAGYAGMDGDEKTGSPRERALLKLWKEFFGKPALTQDDAFFDIGGDSLKALTLIGRIHKTLDAEISVADFFKHSTVRQLSAFLDAASADQPPATSYRPIPPAEKQAHYQLSSVQKRLYFLHEFSSASLQYNLSKVVSIEGPLEKEKFHQAFVSLLARHESLRTFFDLLDNDPVQKIAGTVAAEIEYFYSDRKGVPSIVRNFIRPFDLSIAPLIRLGLIRLGPSDHILLVDMHHIISDGVSFSLLIKDFMSFYTGKDPKDLPLQYKDYAQWQQSTEYRSAIATQKDFWVQHFSGEVPVLEWPADFERPLMKGSEGHVIAFVLDKEETGKLLSIAESEGVTLFMLLLSLYYVLLSKLSNQNDIVIGTSTSGRNHTDLENIIGMFVNALPLRNYPDGERSFKDFLKEVSERALACFGKQAFQYEDLIQELKVERDTSRNPLFDTMFVFQNFENEELRIPGLTVKPYDTPLPSTSKFDLTLTGARSGDTILLEFEYSTRLFLPATIERFIRCFRQIIASVSENISIRLAEINYIPAAEVSTLVYGLNTTHADYPKEDTVTSLFEKQVARTPEKVAVRYEDRTLTYKALDELAGKMAYCLYDRRSIGTGDLVALLMERDEYLVPAILAILKTGAAYVPIDPAFPAARIRLILAEPGIKALVTRRKYLPEPLRSLPDIIDLDEVMGETALENQTRPTANARANDLAYVIYTSGSTGKPKGVMIEHGSLLNYIVWAAKTYMGEEKAVFPLYTSISFDLTVTSIFVPLITGNEMIVYRENKETILIEKILTENRVTIVKLTPSHLKIIRDMVWDKDHSPDNVKKFIVGGEELERQLARDIHEKFGGKSKIYNEYGPTEATVGCMIYTYHPADREKGVPIGMPISNTQIYILDKSLQPSAPGVTGEIYISGEGLARGYLSDSERTQEKFIPNPFIPNKKMYRTGDLGCRRANGDVLYKGRIDGQIKLRGARIETGEIENLLNAYGSIRENLLMVRGSEGNRQLTAFYVSDSPIKTTELRNYLSGRLPEYMIPAFYVHLTAFPLTRNDKIDRKALEAMEITDGSADVVIPGNRTEEIIAHIWSEILGIKMESLGVYSNFFDLGGHSMGVVKMRKMINDHFGTGISVSDIFRLANIHAIAGFISGGDEKLQELEEGLRERTVALDLLQQQLE